MTQQNKTVPIAPFVGSARFTPGAPAVAADPLGGYIREVNELPGLSETYRLSEGELRDLFDTLNQVRPSRAPLRFQSVLSTFDELDQALAGSASRGKVLAFASAARSHFACLPANQTTTCLGLEQQGSLLASELRDPAKLYPAWSLPLSAYERLGASPAVLELMTKIAKLGDDSHYGDPDRFSIDQLVAFEGTVLRSEWPDRAEPLRAIWALLALPSPQKNEVEGDPGLHSPVLDQRLEVPETDAWLGSQVSIDNLPLGLQRLARRAALIATRMKGEPDPTGDPQLLSLSDLELAVTNSRQTNQQQRTIMRTTLTREIRSVLSGRPKPQRLSAEVTLLAPGPRPSQQALVALGGAAAIVVRSELCYEGLHLPGGVHQLLAKWTSSSEILLPEDAHAVLVPRNPAFADMDPIVLSQSGTFEAPQGHYDALLVRRGRIVERGSIALPGTQPSYVNLSDTIGFDFRFPGGPAAVRINPPDEEGRVRSTLKTAAPGETRPTNHASLLLGETSLPGPGRYVGTAGEEHRISVDLLSSGLVLATLEDQDGNRERFRVVGGGRQRLHTHSALGDCTLDFHLNEGTVDVIRSSGPRSVTLAPFGQPDATANARGPSATDISVGATRVRLADAGIDPPSILYSMSTDLQIRYTSPMIPRYYSDRPRSAPVHRSDGPEQRIHDLVMHRTPGALPLRYTIDLTNLPLETGSLGSMEDLLRQGRIVVGSPRHALEDVAELVSFGIEPQDVTVSVHPDPETGRTVIELAPPELFAPNDRINGSKTSAVIDEGNSTPDFLITGPGGRTLRFTIDLDEAERGGTLGTLAELIQQQRMTTFESALSNTATTRPVSEGAYPDAVLGRLRSLEINPEMVYMGRAPDSNLQVTGEDHVGARLERFRREGDVIVSSERDGAISFFASADQDVPPLLTISLTHDDSQARYVLSYLVRHGHVAVTGLLFDDLTPTTAESDGDAPQDPAQIRARFRRFGLHPEQTEVRIFRAHASEAHYEARLDYRGIDEDSRRGPPPGANQYLPEDRGQAVFHVPDPVGGEPLLGWTIDLSGFEPSDDPVATLDDLIRDGRVRVTGPQQQVPLPV